MSSVDTDKIYEELLRIYSARHENPKTILNYRIIELKREGKTREEAILALYEEHRKIKPAEAEKLEKAIKRKKAKEVERRLRTEEEERARRRVLSIILALLIGGIIGGTMLVFSIQVLTKP